MKSELILSILVIPHLLAFSHPIQRTLRFLTVEHMERVRLTA